VESSTKFNQRLKRSIFLKRFGGILHKILPTNPTNNNQVVTGCHPNPIGCNLQYLQYFNSLSKLFRTLNYQLFTDRPKKCFDEEMIERVFNKPLLFKYSKIEKHSMHGESHEYNIYLTMDLVIESVRSFHFSFSLLTFQFSPFLFCRNKSSPDSQ
jgi:hypothetical protein